MVIVQDPAVRAQAGKSPYGGGFYDKVCYPCSHGPILSFVAASGFQGSLGRIIEAVRCLDLVWQTSKPFLSCCYIRITSLLSLGAI